VPVVTRSKEETGRKREMRNKKIEMKKEGLRIGAWNARTLKEYGRLWQIITEMKRYGLNILGISKTHWNRQGDLESNEMRMVYSSGERCERGVAILFNREASERITEIEKLVKD
jgi:hypothetical protein